MEMIHSICFSGFIRCCMKDHTAKLHSSSPENKWRISNEANSEDSYARFKDALHSLLNGSYDNTKFEDVCRALVGAQSHENARFLLLDDSLYRIEFLSRPMCMTIQLMKTDCDKLDPIAVTMDPYFASYVIDTEDFMYRPRRRALYGNGASKGTPDGCRAKRCKLMHY